MHNGRLGERVSVLEPEKARVKLLAGWLWRWVLNNKVVAILLVSLLVLVNLFLLTKVLYLTEPLKGFINAMGLPLVMSGIFYYLLNPVIDWLERKNVPRVTGILLVFLVLSGLITWGVVILIPIIREQTLELIQSFPLQLIAFTAQMDNLLQSDLLSRLQLQFLGDNGTLAETVAGRAEGMINNALGSLGSIFGTLTSIVIAVITTPFILFYLLKDGHNLPYHLMNFVPSKMREKTYLLLRETNMQISQYIRGQLAVAFAVGIMFWIGLSIIGMKYALILAITAGLLNLIPFLGTFIAFFPMVIVAIVVHSPIMLVKVIVVFTIEQTLEGRVIQPLILGSNLNIHPITIIAVLLTAGNLFGIPGVIVGIPAYAIIKVFLVHLFQWYQSYTGLYDDDYNPAPKPFVSAKKKKRILSLKRKL